MIHLRVVCLEQTFDLTPSNSSSLGRVDANITLRSLVHHFFSCHTLIIQFRRRKCKAEMRLFSIHTQFFYCWGVFFQSNRARMCCFPSSPVLLSPCPPRNTLAISFCCKDIDSISFYFCIYSPLDFILLYFCAKITIIFHIYKLFEKIVLYYVQIPLESLSSVDPIIILQLPIEG